MAENGMEVLPNSRPAGLLVLHLRRKELISRTQINCFQEQLQETLLFLDSANTVETKVKKRLPICYAKCTKYLHYGC